MEDRKTGGSFEYKTSFSAFQTFYSTTQRQNQKWSSSHEYKCITSAFQLTSSFTNHNRSMIPPELPMRTPGKSYKIDHKSKISEYYENQINKTPL